MENMPLISVIVPAYCRCEMTKECLDSIAAQTYRNLEIIAVDDGSTDGTPEMLDRYAQKDSRVRVIHQPNGGLSKARNAALDVMRGEYVTFIDNDDYVLPDMVEFLYSIARQYDCDIVSDGSIATEERGITEIEQPELEVKVMTPDEAIWHEELVSLTATHKLYHRRIFANLRYPEGVIHEDVGMRAQTFLHAKRIAAANGKHYICYLSPVSILRSDFSVKRLDILTMRERNLAFLSEHNIGGYYPMEEALYGICVSQLWFYMVEANWPERKKYRKMLAQKRRTLIRRLARNSCFTKKNWLQTTAYFYFPHLVMLFFRLRCGS